MDPTKPTLLPRDLMLPVTVTILDTPTTQDWALVKDLTLGTMGLHAVSPVDEAFKTRMILSEHSPIRNLQVTWEWDGLPSWVSVHLVRHHAGCTHFVQSQRNDRQDNYDRNLALQSARVLHRMTANFQSILDISRKRLCNNAARETRLAWDMFLTALEPSEPELIQCCVPNCVYRNGICVEPHSCKRNQTTLHRGCCIAYQRLIDSCMYDR